MPTDEQRALWSAIRANPLDDTPRLVYADWLQEHGDEARAEFIRVQCAPAAGDTSNVLRTRQHQLLTHFGAEWLKQALPGVFADEVRRQQVANSQLTFERGFLGTLHLRLREAAKLAEAKDTAEPVRSVHIHDLIWDWESEAEELLAGVSLWEFAGCITDLDLVDATGECARILAESRRLTGLKSLSLRDGTLGDAGVQFLTRSPILAQVETLYLDGNQITDEGAIALAASEPLAAVRVLDVWANLIRAEGWRHLHERFGSRLVHFHEGLLSDSSEP